jgi:threonine dehydratase
MSTQQELTTAQKTASANKYTLIHDQDATQIVFFPNRPGPILQGQPATGPELTYKGPEGSFTFFSDKIELQTGPLGSLISVILGAIKIFGGTQQFLRFSLVLPPVNMGETKKQSFETFGVKTATTTGGVSDGAQLEYTVVPLKGLADIVGLPV